MSKDPHTSPQLLVVTAPSGSGKTTVVRHLTSIFDFLKFSVSATTRDARPNEVNGKDYHFLTQEEFHGKVNSQEFVEWEEVYTDQYYGTLKSEVQKIIDADAVAVFDIEVNGAANIKRQYKDQALCVYIAPPSLSELESRLRNRGTETEASIQKRLRRAKQELERLDEFDLVLINDDLPRALKQAEKILRKNFHQHLS